MSQIKEAVNQIVATMSAGELQRVADGDTSITRWMMINYPPKEIATPYHQIPTNEIDAICQFVEIEVRSIFAAEDAKVYASIRKIVDDVPCHEMDCLNGIPAPGKGPELSPDALAESIVDHLEDDHPHLLPLGRLSSWPLCPSRDWLRTQYAELIRDEARTRNREVLNDGFNRRVAWVSAELKSDGAIS